MSPIPPTLAPFFQEYDLTQLNLEKDSAIIIERTLRFGTRAELRWLFDTYSRERISNWVAHWGKFGLSEAHLCFWKLLLGLQDES